MEDPGIFQEGSKKVEKMRERKKGKHVFRSCVWNFERRFVVTPKRRGGEEGALEKFLRYGRILVEIAIRVETLVNSDRKRWQVVPILRSPIDPT